MRLHSDRLTGRDIYAATRAAGMAGVFAQVARHGSRVRANAFEVKLTGTSPRLRNGGRHEDGHAATWDEWGMFLATLFELDPDMIAGQPGRPVYASAAAFHEATGGRFRTLTAPFQHRTHRWVSTFPREVHECASCGATWDYRFMYAPPAVVAERVARVAVV